MKNKNIVVLLRSPFLDKIPSLKNLIVFLSQKGYTITIVSSSDNCYVTFDYESSNIVLKLVKTRKHKLELPTSIKLILVLFKIMILKRPIFYIGGDNFANIILSKLQKIIRIKYINFLLEYPELDNQNEFVALNSSDFIITHDKWHGEFLNKHFGISFDKLLYLPNSTYTPIHCTAESYLYDLLNIEKEKNIILHSGGLGNYFMSKELITESYSWNDNDILVFHTSHNVADTSYYQEIITNLQDTNKVRFSIKPVSNEVLDHLVASATIGLALYSVEVLGYRALYMGLAAGKIGNYLKCGVPVIATKLPSLTYLEEYECGILVEDLSQIKYAISKIKANYNKFQENAYRCYNELWDAKQYLDIIEDKISEYYVK